MLLPLPRVSARTLPSHANTVSTRRFEIQIRNTTRGSIPRVPFERIASSILGRYELSLVITGDALARRLNANYRKKTYAPNVLSFPYGKNEGEIILNIRKAAREARGLRIPERERVAYLFIHACLHLKGLDHGARMDRLEKIHLRRSGFRTSESRGH